MSVCCFQAGSVGREKNILAHFPKKTLFSSKTVIQLSKRQKRMVGGKMVGW